MSDPVVAQDGFSYERANILEWFKNQKTSPTTQEEIETALVPNRNLIETIKKYNETQSRPSILTNTVVSSAIKK